MYNIFVTNYVSLCIFMKVDTTEKLIMTCSQFFTHLWSIFVYFLFLFIFFFFYQVTTLCTVDIDRWIEFVSALPMASKIKELPKAWVSHKESVWKCCASILIKLYRPVRNICILFFLFSFQFDSFYQLNVGCRQNNCQKRKTFPTKILARISKVYFQIYRIRKRRSILRRSPPSRYNNF